MFCSLPVGTVSTLPHRPDETLRTDRESSALRRWRRVGERLMQLANPFSRCLWPHPPACGTKAAARRHTGSSTRSDQYGHPAPHFEPSSACATRSGLVVQIPQPELTSCRGWPINTIVNMLLLHAPSLRRRHPLACSTSCWLTSRGGRRPTSRNPLREASARVMRGASQVIVAIEAISSCLRHLTRTELLIRRKSRRRRRR